MKLNNPDYAAARAALAEEALHACVDYDSGKLGVAGLVNGAIDIAARLAALEATHG